MNVYLHAKTNAPDVVLDFIEMKTKEGKFITLDWKESCYSYPNGYVCAELKLLSCGDEHQELKLDDLQGAEVTAIQIYSEECNSPTFEPDYILFVTADESTYREIMLGKKDFRNCAILVENSKSDIVEQYSRNIEMCFECDAERCAFNPKGICSFPMVYDQTPEWCEDGCLDMVPAREFQN